MPLSLILGVARWAGLFRVPRSLHPGFPQAPIRDKPCRSLTPPPHPAGGAARAACDKGRNIVLIWGRRPQTPALRGRSPRGRGAGQAVAAAPAIPHPAGERGRAPARQARNRNPPGWRLAGPRDSGLDRPPRADPKPFGFGCSQCLSSAPFGARRCSPAGHLSYTTS